MFERIHRDTTGQAETNETPLKTWLRIYKRRWTANTHSGVYCRRPGSNRIATADSARSSSDELHGIVALVTRAAHEVVDT